VVVSKDFAAALLEPRDAFRDKRLLPYVSLDLSEIHVTASHGTFDLEPFGEGAFRERASAVRVDRSVMDRLLVAFADCRAESFPNIELATRSIEAATRHVAVKLVPRNGSQPPFSFRVGGSCESHPNDVSFVTDAETVAERRAACVPVAVLDGLDLQADTLADHGFWHLRKDEIAEFVLDDGTAHYDFARKGNGFRMRAPNVRDLNDEESAGVAGWIARLASARLEPRSAAPAIFPHEMIVRANGSEERVAFDAAFTMARRGQDGAVFSVDATTRRTLAGGALATKPLEILPDLAKLDDVTHVSLACGAHQEVDRAEGRFTYRLPATIPADQGGLVTLVDRVLAEHATAWAAANDDGSFGLSASPGAGSNGGCSLTFEFSGDAGLREATLLFGGPAGKGQVFARRKGDDAVMIVAESLRDAARVLYVDRAGFRVPRSRIARVEIMRGTSVERYAVGDLAPDAGASELGDLVETLLPTPTSLARPLAPADVSLRVFLSRDGGADTVTWHLAKTNEPRVTVWRDGLDATFDAPREELRALLR
jgi:hypothetical protein